MKPNPVLLVGGGTGGHTMPLIAVGEELRRLNRPFIFVGGKTGTIGQLIYDLGWPYRAIESGKWRRNPSFQNWWLNITDLVRVLIGFFQALALIIRTKPTAILSKGGPVAIPVVLAAWLTRRKIVIHESDAVMGLANRFSVPLASRILTAFEPSIFPKADSRYQQVGIPIRATLRQAAVLKAPKKSRPLIFVLAGIQGSVAINKLIYKSLAELLLVTDIVHVTGSADLAQAQQAQKALPPKIRESYRPFSFVDRELPYYYQSADLLISRASATVLSEAALFAKAVFLVPLPPGVDAGGHQRANAEKLAEAGAARWQPQAELDAPKLTAEIKALLADQEKRDQLGQNLKQYFHCQTALADIIKEIS